MFGFVALQRSSRLDSFFAVVAEGHRHRLYKMVYSQRSQHSEFIQNDQALNFIMAFSFLFFTHKWIVSEEMHKVATRLWQPVITCTAHIVNATATATTATSKLFAMTIAIKISPCVLFRNMKLHLVNKWHFILPSWPGMEMPVKLLFTTSFQQLKFFGSMIIPDGAGFTQSVIQKCCTLNIYSSFRIAGFS